MHLQRRFVEEIRIKRHITCLVLNLLNIFAENTILLKYRYPEIFAIKIRHLLVEFQVGWLITDLDLFNTFVEDVNFIGNQDPEISVFAKYHAH